MIQEDHLATPSSLICQLCIHGVSARVETYPRRCLLDELNRKHPVFHTQLHEFGGISCHRGKLDTKTLHPFLKLRVRCNLGFVPVFHQTKAQCNVGLDVSTTTN